jgi:methylated-DNA-[protein]-cysteine S-methyltransferase
MPTRFQQRVYAATRKIPRGRVTTYKLLAQHIGCGSCRAVGQALKRNPYPFSAVTLLRRVNVPQVPCHRVIASDGTLGGFQGRRAGASLTRKARLLAAEGVCFKAGQLAEPKRLFHFPPA